MSLYYCTVCGDWNYIRFEEEVCAPVTKDICVQQGEVYCNATKSCTYNHNHFPNCHCNGVGGAVEDNECKRIENLQTKYYCDANNTVVDNCGDCKTSYIESIDVDGQSKQYTFEISLSQNDGSRR